MDTGLIVLVSILAGVVALGYYMDWFGLWVSQEELKAEVEASKLRTQWLAEPSGNQVGEAVARSTTRTEASGVRSAYQPNLDGVELTQAGFSTGHEDASR